MTHSKKGQGTIEYLVIIAIVVVIALVVVGLLLQIMGSGGGVSETSARAAYKSAQPLGITDWTFKSTAPYLTVVLRNNSADTLTVTAFQYDSSDVNSGVGFPTTATNLPPNGTVSISEGAGASTACTTATKYAEPKAGVIITYNDVTSGVTGEKEYGPADLVGTCQ